MYDLKRDKELNRDFRMKYHDDKSETDDKEKITREKGQPIKTIIRINHPL